VRGNIGRYGAHRPDLRRWSACRTPANHVHQRGLPRTVGPDQPEHGASLDLEADLAERPQAAVTDSDPVDGAARRRSRLVRREALRPRPQAAAQPNSQTRPARQHQHDHDDHRPEEQRVGFTNSAAAIRSLRQNHRADKTGPRRFRSRPGSSWRSERRSHPSQT